MNNQRSKNHVDPSLWAPMQFHKNGMSALWLPSVDFTEPDMRDLGFMRVYVRYSDLFRRQVGWDDIKDRLSTYALWQVLDVASRASAMLKQFEPQNSLEGQKFLCRGIFGPDRAASIWSTLQEWRQSLPEGRPLSGVMLFHELQIVNTIKVALLTMDPAQPSRTDTFEALGEAMLMVNDLIGDDDEAGVSAADLHTDEGRKQWHQHFVSNGLFHHGENDVHALARAYDLYLTDRPHLKDCGCYIDLPNTVTQLTNLSPDLLWTILFALNGHWDTMNPEKVHVAQGALNYQTYFTKSCNFTERESESFFSLVSQSPEMAREGLTRRGCGVGELKPYDLLTLEDRPFLQIDNQVFCSSTRLSFRKLTRGLHHLFLNRMSAAEERSRYLTYMGEVFDDYVHELLTRAFPPASGRYIDGRTLKANLPEGTKSCDGVIIYPDALLLIESKATLFPLDVRVAESWDSYVSKIRDIFGDGGEQIDGTIRCIEGGHYASLGLDPHMATTYIPIVVTLEELPLNPLLFELVDAELSHRNCLGASRIKPLQAIDVANLEFVEVAAETGVDLSELFRSKASDETTRARSFSNFAIERDEGFIRGFNSHLRDQFDEISERAVASVRARARSRQP